MRKIPDAFLKACGSLHQDMDIVAPTLEQKADAMISRLDASERLVVKKYLQKLLVDGTTGAELRNIYRASRSSLGFGKADDLLTLFKLVQQRLQ